MKTKSIILAILTMMLLAFVTAPARAASGDPLFAKVSVTQTNTATTFSADLSGLAFYNGGSSAVFIALGKAATAAGTDPTISEIPAGGTLVWSDVHASTTSSAGTTTTLVGSICASGLTSTLYVYGQER